MTDPDIIDLLSNAFKFTLHGEIAIRASLQDIDGYSDNLQLRGDIIDTGIGIPNGKISQLFETFTQADSSTTSEYGGSGLGLSFVRQLCQLMGGDVDVLSEKGKGSRFGFSLKLVTVRSCYAPFLILKWLACLCLLSTITTPISKSYREC